MRLTIPEPCHEDWAAMSPQAHGRFCAACAKTVVDFTAMSDAEIVKYLERAAASTCGRLRSDQLERELHVPAVASTTRRWWVGGLASLLTAQLAIGQTPTRVSGADLPTTAHHDRSSVAQRELAGAGLRGQVAVQAKPTTAVMVTGIVVDAFGEALIGAVVQESNAEGEVINGTATDVDGRFELTLESAANALRVSHAGYMTRAFGPLEYSQVLPLRLVLGESSVDGGVIVSGGMRQSRLPLPWAVRRALLTSKHAVREGALVFGRLAVKPFRRRSADSSLVKVTASLKPLEPQPSNSSVDTLPIDHPDTIAYSLELPEAIVRAVGGSPYPVIGGGISVVTYSIPPIQVAGPEPAPRLFPNPGHSEVFVSTAGLDGLAQLVNVYSVQGQLIFSTPADPGGRTRLAPLTKLTPGTHLVEVSGVDGAPVWTGFWVVQ